MDCESILVTASPAFSRLRWVQTVLKRTGAAAQRKIGAEKELTALREIVEFAIDKAWLACNPAQRVKVVKPARAKSRAEHEEGSDPLSVEDLQVIFRQTFYRGCKDDETASTYQEPIIHAEAGFGVL